MLEIHENKKSEEITQYHPIGHREETDKNIRIHPVDIRFSQTDFSLLTAYYTLPIEYYDQFVGLVNLVYSGASPRDIVCYLIGIKPGRRNGEYLFPEIPPSGQRNRRQKMVSNLKNFYLNDPIGFNIMIQVLAGEYVGNMMLKVKREKTREVIDRSFANLSAGLEASKEDIEWVDIVVEKSLIFDAFNIARIERRYIGRPPPFKEYTENVIFYGGDKHTKVLIDYLNARYKYPDGALGRFPFKEGETINGEPNRCIRIPVTLEEFFTAPYTDFI